MSKAYPTQRHDYDSDEDERLRLEQALEVAPRGALIVSGVAVALLMFCWFSIYLFVFLPRGTIG